MTRNNDNGSEATSSGDEFTPAAGNNKKDAIDMLKAIKSQSVEVVAVAAGALPVKGGKRGIKLSNGTRIVLCTEANLNNKMSTVYPKEDCDEKFATKSLMEESKKSILTTVAATCETKVNVASALAGLATKEEMDDKTKKLASTEYVQKSLVPYLTEGQLQEEVITGNIVSNVALAKKLGGYVSRSYFDNESANFARVSIVESQVAKRPKMEQVEEKIDELKTEIPAMITGLSANAEYVQRHVETALTDYAKSHDVATLIQAESKVTSTALQVLDEEHAGAAKIMAESVSGIDKRLTALEESCKEKANSDGKLFKACLDGLESSDTLFEQLETSRKEKVQSDIVLVDNIKKRLDGLETSNAAEAKRSFTEFLTPEVMCEVVAAKLESPEYKEEVVQILTSKDSSSQNKKRDTGCLGSLPNEDNNKKAKVGNDERSASKEGEQQGVDMDGRSGTMGTGSENGREMVIFHKGPTGSPEGQQRASTTATTDEAATLNKVTPGGLSRKLAESY